VPPGYVVHRVGSTWLILDRARSAELVPLRLADPSIREGLFTRSPRRGRGNAPTVTVDSGLSIVLRRYRHGGLFGALTGPLLLGPQRALSELQVTSRAEAAGAPVPHVLCVVLWPLLGPLWSAMIGTEEEAQAQDLLAAWHRRSEQRDRCRLLRRVGEAIRRLHDAGVEHPDLQVRNILLCSAPPERIVVIDLDRARLRGATPPPTRVRGAHLARLVRSLVKEGLIDPRAGCARELASLLGGYAGRDRALRRDLLRRARWERPKLNLHRIGYALRSGL
jgi:3-deoxy-D-manno-octulosonic acid kinase